MLNKTAGPEPIVDYDLTPEGKDFIATGAKLWKSKAGNSLTDLDEWEVIGDILQLGRDRVMVTLEIAVPAGKKYSAAFSAWRKEAGFTEPDIDAQTISYLLYLHEHWEVCSDVWDAMEEGQRMRINHPVTMAQHVRRHLQKLAGIKPATKPAKPAQQTTQPTTQPAAVHTSKSVKSETVSPVQEWLAASSPNTIAGNIFNAVGKEKAIEIRDALTKKIDKAGA